MFGNPRMPATKIMPAATLWLAALVVLAPWPAFSQVSSEWAAEAVACETLEDMAAIKDSICENSGFLCRPEPSECERFCKNATQTCFRSGRTATKSRTLLVQSEFRGLARLCAGESDASLCRRLLRETGKFVKSEARQFIRDLRESCGGEYFKSACNAACLEPSEVDFDCSIESLETGVENHGMESSNSDEALVTGPGGGSSSGFSAGAAGDFSAAITPSILVGPTDGEGFASAGASGTSLTPDFKLE